MTPPRSPRSGSPTAAREQAWHLTRLVPGSPLAHVAVALRLTGDLDARALVGALRAAVARHPSLATRFTADGLPTPRSGAAAIEVVVHGGAESVDDVVRAPFDVTTDPLVRACLLREDERGHLLVLVAHRLVCDEASAALLLAEVAAAYPAPPSSPDAPTPRRARAWGSLPAALATAPELPLDRPRPALRDLVATTVPFDLPAAALRDLAARCGTDLPTTALALYLALLHRYSGQADVEVSARVDQAGEVGCFTTAAVLRVAVAATTTFRDLVDLARLPEVAAGSPSAVLTLPGFSFRTASRVTMAGLDVEVSPVHPGVTARDLDLDLVEHEDRIAGRVTVAADVFDEATAHRAAGHLRRLLDGLAGDPDRRVADLPVTTSEEDAAVAASTSPGTGPGLPFHRRFEEWAARDPQAIAVRAEDVVLGYGELNRRANQLAHLLRDLGVGPEVTVGVCFDRDVRLVVAVLGVLKAGGAYVPVDPRDPAERRATILADAAVRVVVGAEPLDTAVRVVELDRDWTALDGRSEDDPPADPDALSHAAYLLYTSGSTGRPKGVVVEHRQLMGYTDAVVERFELDRPLSFAMVQPLTVDSSVTALVPPLCTGGQVHLISRERALDADRFADWVRAEGVDCLKIAPSHLRALQASPRFAELLPRRLLVVGGEASDWQWLRSVQRLVPECRVFNHYGPTETTVGVLTLAVADHPDADWDTTPIGVPLPGTTAHVVDGSGLPVPFGVVGELLVGGVTVARGYHGRDDLTAAAFLEGPERLYRTGDFVRRLADGSIAFLGRRDDQIKVRGFRVELGEIDAALKGCAGVRNAMTIVREDVPGDRRIVAYVEPDPTSFTLPALDRHVRAAVPGHMVPQAVVVLDRLPLTGHGKVDRSALPPPPAERTSTTPRTELDRVVAEVWKEVLRTDSVGMEQNFFDLGGHSLLLVELQHRLRAAVDREVELLDLFQHTTVRAQAAYLATKEHGAAPAASRARGSQQNALLKRRQQQRQAKRGRHE